MKRPTAQPQFQSASSAEALAGAADLRPAAPAWAHAMVAPLLLAALAIALAGAARFAWVESHAMAAACDAAAWQRGCVGRSLVIQSFVEQRLAWFSWVFAVAATVLRARWAAALALVVGAAGLVLYCTELAAPAVLLALLVFARPGPR